MAYSIYIENHEGVGEKVNKNFDTYQEALQFLSKKLMLKIRKHMPNAILYDVKENTLLFNQGKHILSRCILCEHATLHSEKYEIVIIWI